MNDHKLTEYANEIAQDIFDEMLRDMAEDETPENYRDEMSERAFEYADGSEHVIYYAKAHAICQNCDVSNGESELEDMGGPVDKSYDGFAVAIAFCELRIRIESQINVLIDNWES